MRLRWERGGGEGEGLWLKKNPHGSYKGQQFNRYILRGVKGEEGILM